MALRVVAATPGATGLFRVDQLVAALARRSLWLTDAYYAGTGAYVQALRAAAQDGVDVRLLVPGRGSDIPVMQAVSRSGYRVLLEAGVRVFEWNGPMVHAKTAVADGRWARVGSTNLNLASWIGNRELDVIVEDDRFARAMEEQYARDLANSTEVVLSQRRVRAAGNVRTPRTRGAGGSANRAAAGVLRIGNALGAALVAAQAPPSRRAAAARGRRAGARGARRSSAALLAAGRRLAARRARPLAGPRAAVARRARLSPPVSALRARVSRGERSVGSRWQRPFRAWHPRCNTAQWRGADEGLVATCSDDRLQAAARTLVAALLAVCASAAIPAHAPARHPLEPLPPPPYPRFAGQTFEPSAAAYDPASGRVLVLSDHDTTLYRYELGAEGLVLPAGEHHYPLRLPEGERVAKLEGLTRLPSGDFLAVTAFDRPDPAFRRLLRFSYAAGVPVDAVPLPVDDAALGAAVRAASGLPWFKIEAVATDRAGARVLFGIREVGESYAAPRDVALVVRCPLAENGVGAPEAVIRLSTGEALGGLAEGLSDLQPDPDGDSFLILTSHEATEPTRDAHSGHLFRVPASVLLGPDSAGAGPARGAAAGLARQARGAGRGAHGRAHRGLRRRPRLQAPLRRLRAVGRPVHGDRAPVLTGA